MYKTIHEFNFDSIDYFEHIKSNLNLSYNNNNNNLKNTYSNFIKNAQNILINNNADINNNIKKNNLINIIMNSTSNPKYNKRNNKKNNNINDKNSINGSLLNGSMNGSSLLILNNSNINNNLINLNNDYRGNNSFISNINESNNEKNIKEESIDSLLNFISKILPISLKISSIFILLITFCYIICCCGNIIVLSLENKIWEYSINLSMNVLERIPKLMALLIYTSSLKLTLLKIN